MKILIQFPTRSRPLEFFKTVKIYIDKAKDLSNMVLNISCDSDDILMNNQTLIKEIKSFPIESHFNFNPNKTKIEAVNANLNDFDYDIILLASDDMVPRVDGYDEVIRQKMKEFYPDTDGILFFNDGYCGKTLNTLSILGRKYFQRFNYIYNPEYISLWADNEFMEVGDILGKQTYIDECIIGHEHWCRGSGYGKWDDLYARNDAFYGVDGQMFSKRKTINFEL